MKRVVTHGPRLDESTKQMLPLMFSTKFITSHAFKARASLLGRCKAGSRKLSIFHLPKDGSLCQPISVVVNKKGDVIYRFVEEGIATETLTFVEEPIGMTARQGFGFLQTDLKERIGPGNRYEILRKLGRGTNSSVWLAKDTVQYRFVAVKALHGHATKLIRKGIMRELDVLRRISCFGKGMQETHCLSLLDEFVHPGKCEADGEHLCLVTDPLGPSVYAFRDRVGRFTKPLIKKMLLQMLVGLNHLHTSGIVHTDLKPENVLMDLGRVEDSLDIDAFIKEHPANKHPPERTWGGKLTRVAVSQPFPVPTFDDSMTRSFILGDFGSAQFLKEKVTDTISSPDLRPPEIFLGLPWDEKVDIWSFGCLVFEFINDQKLFKTNTGKIHPVMAILWQMHIYTGDRLSPELIRSSPEAMQYLNPETGWLRSKFPEDNVDMHEIIKDIGALKKPEDIEGATALLKKCLRLNPKDRASAKELLQDPWLNTET